MPTHVFTLTADTGDSTWSNPSNAVSQDGVFASTTANLQTLSFNYSTSVIPSGAVIDNITVTVRGYRVSLSSNTFYLRDIGSRGFSDSSPHVASFTGLESTYTLVNDTGANMGVTADNINAIGRIRFRNTAGGTGTMFVDAVTFSVTYTAAGIAVPVLFMGENF